MSEPFRHRRRRSTTFVMSLIGLLGMVSCGAEQAPKQLSDYLPNVITGTTLTRTGEVRLFAGTDLWEYINGDAEIYQQYHFVEVATADYQSGDVELIADIYRFADDESAYGLFTAIRPDDSEPIALGIAGIVSETSLDCVFGYYLVRLTTFTASEQVQMDMRTAAQTLVASLPGTTQKPEFFALFPEPGSLPAGDRIYASSFMGRRYLTRVFTQDFAIGADTVTLFLSPDSGWAKLELWAEELGAPAEESDLPFANGRAITMAGGFHGPVVAGVSGNFLAGMIGYEPRHRDFLAAWLQSLPQLVPG